MSTFSEVGSVTGPLPPEVRFSAQPVPEPNQPVLIMNIYELIRCLAAGHTVHGTVQKFASWDRDVTAASGMVAYPDFDEEPQSLVPVRLFGYDTGKCRVTFESEALPPDWGDQGAGHMLFGYVERYMTSMIAYLPPTT